MQQHQSNLADYSHGGLTTLTSKRLTTCPKRLTKAVLTTYNLLKEGHTQSSISRIKKISRTAVWKHINKLTKLGLIKRDGKSIRLTVHTGGISVKPLGLRWFSIKYNVKNFNLGTKDIPLANTTKQIKTYPAGFTVDKTAKKDGSATLVIFPPWIKGTDPFRMQYSQVEACKAFARKLNHWYNLKLNPDAWEISREGEFNHDHIKKVAEELYKEAGQVKTDIAKIDNSLKNGGEFQTVGANETARFMAMPRELALLKRELEETKTYVKELNNSITELVVMMRPKPPAPEMSI